MTPPVLTAIPGRALLTRDDHAVNLRLKATLIHFLVSATLAGLASLIILRLWFPGGYATALNAQGLLFLLIGCDVIVGPLMSLVICDPNKSRRTLMKDYAVIISVQVAALVYGISVVMDSRPVFAVFTKDRFNIVSAFEVERDPAHPVSLSLTGPQLVALQLPEDTEGRNRVLDMELSGKELQAMPQFYVPYRPEDALAAAKPVSAARADMATALRTEIARQGLREDDVVWLPSQTRFGLGTLLLDRQDGSVRAFVAIDAFGEAPAPQAPEP